MLRTLEILALSLIVAIATAGCGASSAGPASAPAEPAKAAVPAKPAEPASPAAAAPAPAAKPAAPAQPPAAKPAPEKESPAKPSAAVAPKNLLAGSTSSTSSHYAYFVAAAKVINAKLPNVNVTVAETGGGGENTSRMAKGEMDLGSTTSDLLSLAYNGLGPYKDKPVKELRWLWLYNLNQLALIVREDSGIKKLEDLEGREFNPCGRGQACEQMAKAALDALGIKGRWYVGDVADAVQAVKDRRIVGYGKPMAGQDVLDATMLDLMTVTKIRLLGFTEEQAKKIQAAYPYYSFTYVSPNVFKDQEWNKERIRTMAIVVGIAATTRMPEDIAYGMVKAISEDNIAGGPGVQVSAFPAVKGLDFGKLTVEDDLLSAPPLHAGAYKYYKEIGKKIPEKLTPPEARR